MVKVTLPDFYMALVLDDTQIRKSRGQPTKKHVDALHQPACDYLVKQLQPKFSTLSKIEMPFSNLEVGSNKPTPGFHVYWQVKKATAHFETTIDNIRTPDPQDLFDIMAENFNEAFCRNVIRKTNTNTSPLALMVEVQVQRLKPRMTEGGSVQMPPFYVAYMTEEKPLTRKLNDKEKDKLTKHTHREATKHLKTAYGDDFEKLTLKITKVEINEAAGKPESKFNLYVQFEGTAVFKTNAPEDAMLVFRPLTNCMSRDFLGGTRDCGGPILGDAVKMAIRVVVFSELDIPTKLRRGTLETDVRYIPCKIHLEFYVALVVRELKSLPGSSDLQKLDDLIHSFFAKCLEVWYPNFIDLKLESKPEFEAGRPLERFNMLHQYHAVMRFQQPPDPVQVLTKIVNCNVVALLSHVNSNSTMWKRTAEVTLGRGLAPLPSDHIFNAKIEALREEEEKKTRAKKKATPKKRASVPVTMRERETAKPPSVTPDKPKPRPRTSAAPKVPLPPKPRARTPPPPATKKHSPKAKPKSPPTPPEPAPKKHSPKAKPKVAPAPAPPVKKPASRSKSEVPAVAKKGPPAKRTSTQKKKSKESINGSSNHNKENKQKAKAVAPKPETKKTPNDEDGGFKVSTSDVYLSLTVSECPTEPSKSNYDKLCKSAVEFYAWHLKNVFGDNFQKVNVSVHYKEFDTGKVDPKYNVYVEWELDAYFENEATAPDRHKLCESLIHLDLMKMLVDYIRKIKATPFQDSIAIYTQQVNS